MLHISIVHSFLLLNSVPLYDYITVYPVMDIWVVSSFWLTTKGAFIYKSLIGHWLLVHVGKYLGVEWLNCMVGVCYLFYDAAKLFPKVIVPFYITTNIVRVLVPSHPLPY